jgi:hypothetical protein
MPNYGLMTEMANGIKEGMLAFQTQKQIQRQNQMEGLLKGVQQNAETGQMEFTPEMKAQRAQAAKIQQAQAAGYDPGSGTKLLGGLLGQDALAPDMSLEQAKDVMPALVAKLRSEKAPNDAQQDYLRAKTDYLRAGGAPKPSQEFKQASELRKEYNSRPEVKTFRDVQTQYDKIKYASQHPSAAGDLSLIFGYMKMLDPGSTVREGEFATAQNAAGIPERIRNEYNKAKSGERLNPIQREDFLSQAEGLFQSHQKSFDTAKGEYTDLADITKVNPQLIFGKGAKGAGGLLAPKSSAPSTPTSKLGNKYDWAE